MVKAINAIKKLKYAKITEKQAIYIINTVILTRIAYHIQNSKLPKTICNNITQSYTKIAKHKAGLATSIPNSTMFYHKIYALRKVNKI